MENSIDLYEATRLMKKITEKGLVFSFQAMSYDRSRQKSNGIIKCERARLRKKPKSDNPQDDLFIYYLDDDNLPKKIHESTLMFFNGLRVNLK